MTKSQSHFTWIEEIYQQKQRPFQAVIFTGFDMSSLSSMCIIIDHFIDSADFSFFDQYYKTDKIHGGRPNYDYKIILKIYLYTLYYHISFRKVHLFCSLGSELHYLSQELPRFPQRDIFTQFLKILDMHIDDILYLSLAYIQKEIVLDTSNLYGDGTIFEAHNNRHKIITDTNIERSNKKWKKILENPVTQQQEKEIAVQKLMLNKERKAKLADLNRASYGRTDEDSVILKDKGGTFIAGYNVQYIEEGNHGLIVYAYISNKNPDSAAFLDIVDDIIDRYNPKNITLDAGYGTPEILTILSEHHVNAAVKALKNENGKKKITDYSFALSQGEDYLICPQGQILEKLKEKSDGRITFKAIDCQHCEDKKECLGKAKVKRVTIDMKEFSAMKKADTFVNSEDGKELYLHRGNKCESPHGFIMYNLRGKKLTMNGLDRNNTSIKSYAILYNLRRFISIKSAQNKS